ncbi:phosphoadenosine phosphosulfate reductase family protein [Bailinhaonella thermotolerans]|uniref:phosphoadenosine phosphosulfate reductase family protein n=1 Tax=Bailinhaonella thermotolerans TaxID=1070861 RepID=UPI001F5B2A63|nr:phosphoadenosine phosphosulfate reductase family protein [Bailinhaonella thermotolerans]
MLSLGAGVQSSTLLLLAVEGAIPRFDAAIFADTGWEPREVYAHLDRMEQTAARVGIPILRVSTGNLRTDLLNPTRPSAYLPLFVRNPDGTRGLLARQCTHNYKIRPIKAKIRELLGYPHPRRVPPGVFAEQAIGISLEEIHRAKDADVRYLRNVFPLLNLGWTRADCHAVLTAKGWPDVPKSACLGCPFHGNTAWRRIRDTDPDAWAELLDFDAAIRHGLPRTRAMGRPPRGTFYLHRSCRPLAQASLDDDTHTADPDGCSPWSCRNGSAEQSPPATEPAPATPAPAQADQVRPGAARREGETR